MAAQTRFLMLVLVLAYSIVFGPGQALGDGSRGHRLVRWKVPRLRLHRHHAPKAAPHVDLGVRVVRYARRLLGVPYRYGGDSPQTGFDCSGFVRFVYARFGLTLPHSSYADFNLGRRVSRGSLRPGDLVFFDGVGHVGMYIGGGRFIHAPHTGTRVQVTSLNEPWYRSSYDGARRLITPRHHHRHHACHGGRRPVHALSNLRLF
jgi:hypothetical protein